MPKFVTHKRGCSQSQILKFGLSSIVDSEVKGFIILWAKGKDSGHDLTFFVKKYYGLWQPSCLFDDI